MCGNLTLNMSLSDKCLADNVCNGSVGQDQCVLKVCPTFGVDKDQVWLYFVCAEWLEFFVNRFITLL